MSSLFLSAARVLCAAALAVLSAAPAAAQRRIAVVEFTSTPSGATVAVDGEVRGTTPLKLYDLDPAALHRATWTKEGFRRSDTFFRTAPDGGAKTVHAGLERVKGLALVLSDPPGASITKDGYSLGETPRLLTELDADDPHTLLLRKPGFLDAKTELRFDGRNPLAVSVRLTPDSGTLFVESDPSGAEVSVNGTPRGKTPAVIEGVPRGRAAVAVSLPGYAPETRTVAVAAGERATVAFALRGLPAALELASSPEGARFYIDGKPQGKGPLTLRGLAPGRHTVRAELDGYAPETRFVELERGASAKEEFRLASILGRIEVKTSPPGAAIEIDGKPCGSTKASDPAATTSDILVVEGIAAGEHLVSARRDGCAAAERHVKVSPSSAARVSLRLKKVFVPDVRIHTSTGPVEGVFVSGDGRNVVIETSMGVQRSIPREVIRRVEYLER